MLCYKVEPEDWGSAISGATGRLIQGTRENATNGTPMPDKAKAMARQALLCSRVNAFLFFMGAASHYPMFGK